MAGSARGVDILLMKESKTTPGTFVAIAGQRNATFKEENEPIDTSSKMTGGYLTQDYGLGNWGIDCDGVYVTGEQGLKELKDAQRNREQIKVRWTESGTTEVEEGMAIITSREIEAPYDGESTYSLELTGAGKPETVTVAP
jgi:TP901-1 family phage major tail protein